MCYNSIMKKLARYLKYFKWQVIIGPLSKLLESITELIVPLIMAKIIDVGIATNNLNYIIEMGLLIVGLNIAGLIFATICQKCASLTSVGVGRKIRKDMYKAVNDYSHAEIDKLGTASFVTRITDDVQQVENMIGVIIRNVLRAPFLMIGATILAITVNPKLSLIFFAVVPTIGAALWIIIKMIFPYFTIMRNRLDKVSQVTRENLSGVRVVRAFNKQEYEKNRFHTTNEQMVNTQLKVGKIAALLNPLTFLIVDIAVIAVLYFGGIQVNIGGMKQGQLIAFVEYLLTITISIIVVARILVVVTRTTASAKRINAVLDSKPSVIEINHTEMKEVVGAPILEFKDVSFSYDNSMTFAIKNLNLQLKKGQTLGIIGGTASGKTSIINLIPRFYDTTLGEILVSGTNVKEYPIKQLRTKIGIVPQKAILFSGSLRENLKYRKSDATDDQIYEALEVAQASSFVKAWANNLDYQIMAGGKNVSGGQMQRLTIARALVGKPDILILDDSSSSLDYTTDLNLRRALKKLQCTTIIVSQRASSVKNADLILVLENGEVIGRGKHDSLLQNCEIYKEIYDSQTLSKGVNDEK